MSNSHKSKIEELKEKGDVKSLVQLLNNEKDVSIREEVAKALGEIGDASVFKPLMAAQNSSEYQVSMAAAKALVAIGEPVVEMLVATLDDPIELERLHANWVLALIGDKRAVQPVIKLLNDDADKVRQRAAWALGQLKDDSAIKPLINALDDPNDLVRQSAVESLGQIGHEEAVESLIKILEGQDQQKGTSLAQEMFGIPDSGLFASMLTGQGDQVKIATARALGQIGGVQARESLESMKNDENENIRKAIVNALSLMK